VSRTPDRDPPGSGSASRSGRRTLWEAVIVVVLVVVVVVVVVSREAAGGV